MRTLIRSWKSSFQAGKCCDQKNEEATLTKKVVAPPWMGRSSRRKQDQLLYIPQGHPPGGRPRAQRGLHWYGLPPCWTSAIPGHLAAFSIAFPTFPPALCSPWQVSPWSGGHLCSCCYWAAVALLCAQALPAAETFPESKGKTRPQCTREYEFSSITALCSLGSVHAQVSLPPCYLFPAGYALQSAAVLFSGIHAGGTRWDFPIWVESPHKQAFMLKGKEGPTASGNS